MRIKQLDYPARVKMLETCLEMFLIYGYSGTSYNKITNALQCKPASFTNFFGSKENVLLELVKRTSPLHFEIASRMAGEDASPAVKYGLTCGIQLAMCTQSEVMRDIYIAAYTLPLPRTFIMENSSAMTQAYFADRLPDWRAEDFYAAEMATTGVEYIYMDEKRVSHWTLEQKVRSELDNLLKVYEFSKEERRETLDAVFAYDLVKLAEETEREIITRVRESLTYSADI